MGTVQQILTLLIQRGSDVIYHRDDSSVPCPCRTPEGYKDPIWHLEHPNSPQCNNAGFLIDSNTVEFQVKGFVQPIQSSRATRLRSEYVESLFGEIQTDDHLGIFPCEWDGHTLRFEEWGSSTEDWIIYNGNKYTVVNSNLIPDPDDGNPRHHYEVALRLVSN